MEVACVRHSNGAVVNFDPALLTQRRVSDTAALLAHGVGLCGKTLLTRSTQIQQSELLLDLKKKHRMRM